MVDWFVCTVFLPVIFLQNLENIALLFFHYLIYYYLSSDLLCISYVFHTREYFGLKWAGHYIKLEDFSPKVIFSRNFIGPKLLNGEDYYFHSILLLLYLWIAFAIILLSEISDCIQTGIWCILVKFSLKEFSPSYKALFGSPAHTYHHYFGLVHLPFPKLWRIIALWGKWNNSLLPLTGIAVSIFRLY